MKRLEYKYLVPVDALDAVRERIRRFVVPDKHMGTGTEYSIRSIYFDTADLDYYYQKESGIQHRRKLRVRGYGLGGDDAPTFLEIKRKDDMSVSKARAAFRFADTEALFATGDVERYLETGGDGERTLRDGRAFFYHLHRYSLLPVVLVCYEREAYFGLRDSSLRITLDKNLRSAPFPQVGELYSENRHRRSLAGYFVIEVKFYGGMPAWMRQLLDLRDLGRQAVSKYAISLDEHGIPQKRGGITTWAFAHRNNFRQRVWECGQNETSYRVAAG